MTTMNRVREYVEKLSFEELHQIVDEWEKWEQSGVTAKDSPMRVHAIKAWPEMDESSYIVQRMRDVSFEVFRRFFYETLGAARESASALTGKTEKQEHEEWDKLRTIAREKNYRHEGTDSYFVMPAGEYWIGDPCYVQPDDLRKIYLDLSDELKGMFTIKGVTFGAFSTKHGDGSYPWELKSPYTFEENPSRVVSWTEEIPVDSGTIGIIPLKSIIPNDGPVSGLIVHFSTTIICQKINGKIYFGNLEIDTDPKVTDDDDA